LLLLQDVTPKRSTTALQTRLEGAFDASVSMGSTAWFLF